jgi:hypothetical protein
VAVFGVHYSAGKNIIFFSIMVLQAIQFPIQQEQDILSDMQSGWGVKLVVHLPSTSTF